jgi:phosphoribosylformylglycinamidine synthase
VSKGARASVIGKIRDDTQYIVHNGKEKIVDAPAAEVTEGFLYDRYYEARENLSKEPEIPEPFDYNEILLKILSHENMASREPVFETYDKQVQGRTHTETGLADAGIMAPFNSENYPEEIRNVGIALSTDNNPRHGLINPYWGGVNAVVEAMRNVAAVGATPHAISDCLCFGNPEKPHQMWEFVESVRGVADACHTITLKDSPDDATPIIAGNVSFYNESQNGPIPPSPIVPMHFQKTDSVLLLIGERKDELGGSIYYSLYNELGAYVPNPKLDEVKNQIYAITDCIDRELLFACHDIADGGIASALAEMTFGKTLGCKVNIESNLSLSKILFSETGGFVAETPRENVEKVQSVFLTYGLEAFEIGSTGGESININEVIDLKVVNALTAWTNGLRDKL